MPEVETICRGLERRIVGARIGDVRVVEPRLRRPVDVGALERLVGKRVVGIDRRAKYIVVELEDDAALILHLGMSGRVLLVPHGEPPQPHVHVVWSLQHPPRHAPEDLHFRDPRRFGLVEAARISDLCSHPLLARLGPEPLDERTTVDDLASRAQASRRSIKSYLMDSRMISGIGNIYASEALWRARIHPRTAAGRMALSRWQRLLASVRHVLHAAIDAGGTTLNDFRDEDGNLGYFAVDLEVYGREGEPCRECSRLIRKVDLGGRSTFYCPRCQRI